VAPTLLWGSVTFCNFSSTFFLVYSSGSAPAGVGELGKAFSKSLCAGPAPELPNVSPECAGIHEYKKEGVTHLISIRR